MTNSAADVQERLHTVAVHLSLLRRQMDAGLTGAALKTVSRLQHELNCLKAHFDPGPADRL